MVWLNEDVKIKNFEKRTMSESESMRERERERELGR